MAALVRAIPVLLVSAAVTVASGCGSAHSLRTYDSVVAAGLVEPSLLPPRPPPARSEEVAISGWSIEDAKDMADLGERFAALLRKRPPAILAFGELYTPWWVPEYPAATYLAKDILPRIATEFGYRDLVLEYLTQDVPGEEVRAVTEGKPAPMVDMALQDFFAADLIAPASKLGLRLHKGGYTPARDRRWSLDDLAVRGAPASKTMRCNPHYVDITAEIKKNSLAHLLRLRSEGKRAIWFGGTEIAEIEEEIDFLAAPAFESDLERYTATREAGAMGADLRALGLDADYAAVFILPPNHVQHQGRLNEAQYERMWRLKKTHPRLIWRTIGRSLKIVLLLPYEKHRITTMDPKVRAGTDDE